MLAHGATSTADDVRSYNEQVARYMRLGDVVVIDAIPKSPSGKILRDANSATDDEAVWANIS